MRATAKITVAAVIMGFLAVGGRVGALEGPPDWKECDVYEYHMIEGTMYRTGYGYEDVNGHLVAEYSGGIYTNRFMDCDVGEWLW